MDISTTESGVGSGASETLQIVPRSSGELSPTASDKKIVLMTVEAFEQIVLLTMADCATDNEIVPVKIVKTIFETMNSPVRCQALCGQNNCDAHVQGSLLNTEFCRMPTGDS